MLNQLQDLAPYALFWIGALVIGYPIVSYIAKKLEKKGINLL